MRFKSPILRGVALGTLLLGAVSAYSQQPKIYIAFQWHMHQPIYTPG